MVFSFIGHSLGCVLVRAALSSARLASLYPRLHTFLSCCGPHLGTLYATSSLVAMGMWALQKLKKSRSLLQLRLRDHPDPRETFLYRLSAAEGIDHFRYVLLVASPQDHYVPHHSSRIELCRPALSDSSEMGLCLSPSSNPICISQPPKELFKHRELDRKDYRCIYSE